MGRRPRTSPTTKHHLTRHIQWSSRVPLQAAFFALWSLVVTQLRCRFGGNSKRIRQQCSRHPAQWPPDTPATTHAAVALAYVPQRRTSSSIAQILLIQRHYCSQHVHRGAILSVASTLQDCPLDLLAGFVPPTPTAHEDHITAVYSSSQQRARVHGQSAVGCRLFGE